MPATGEPTIELTDCGVWWVATDVETGVTSQGKARQNALENLDEALAGYHGAGDPPSDEELRAFGIDPDRNVSGSLEASDQFE